jgi:hypothetical protein
MSSSLATVSFAASTGVCAGGAIKEAASTGGCAGGAKNFSHQWEFVQGGPSKNLHQRGFVQGEQKACRINGSLCKGVRSKDWGARSLCASASTSRW